MKLKIYYRGEDSNGRPVYEDEAGRMFADDVSGGSGTPRIYLIDSEAADQEVFVGDKYDFIFMPRYVTREAAKMHFLHQTCPMCGKKTILHMDLKTMRQMEAYNAGDGLIQDCLPNLTKYERELIKTGYCYSCQDRLFSIQEFDQTDKATFEQYKTDLVVCAGFGHEGGQWNHKMLSENKDVSDQDVLQEVEAFFSYMTESLLNRGRGDIPVLCEFFAAEMKDDHEYILYFEGRFCVYWVRLLDKEADYHMRIHCYLQEWA